MVSGDFISVRVLQNENVKVTWRHPRRQLSPGLPCSKELSLPIVHLNVNPGVCRPSPADIVVRSNLDASVLWPIVPGSSVKTAGVSGLVVAKLLAAGPAIASHIAIQVAI